MVSLFHLVLRFSLQLWHRKKFMCISCTKYNQWLSNRKHTVGGSGILADQRSILLHRSFHLQFSKVYQKLQKASPVGPLCRTINGLQC